MLTLGIPGDAVTAVLIGALYVHGLKPGPMLMIETPHLFWFTVGNLLLANLALLAFGLAGARAFARIAEVPRAVLVPLILVLCAVGTFAIRNSLADVWWMLGFGITGYGLRLYGFQPGPIILGMILGPLMDASWRRTVIAAGDDVLAAADEAAGSTISIILIAAILLIALRSVFRSKRPA
jgi:putative tricarboxylic transport membrane protein